MASPITNSNERELLDRRSVLVMATGAATAVASNAVTRPVSAAVRSSDVVMMDAVALADAIRSRQVSCVEVMTAYLDHIENLNHKVNAIVALQNRTALLAQSQDRDAQLARGELMGPLHGFPSAVKDLAPVKGIPMTLGSPILKDFVPTADSIMVERLRKAGAIFIGKTNTPEFGLGSHTYNPVYGTTRNAYDQSRSAGGSSGGAANVPAKRAMMKPEAIFEVESGLKLTAFDITAASVVRTEWYQAVRRFFEKYDYFIVPTAQLFPFDANIHWPEEIAGKKMQTYHEWMKGVLPITMSGCPALAAPAGFSDHGLPIGIQIIGPNHSELSCLQMAYAYDTATNWATKRLPPLLSQ